MGHGSFRRRLYRIKKINFGQYREEEDIPNKMGKMRKIKYYTPHAI